MNDLLHLESSLKMAESADRAGLGSAAYIQVTARLLFAILKELRELRLDKNS